MIPDLEVNSRKLSVFKQEATNLHDHVRKSQSTNPQAKQVIGLQSTHKNCFKICLQSTINLLIWSTIYNPNYGQIYNLQ